MANINDKTLQDLNKTLNAKWTAAFEAAPQRQLTTLATQYTSTTASNHYAFMEAMGGWSEWNGARQFKDVASQQFEVKNKDYECSIKMPKNQLEDDQIGMYVDLVPSMVNGWSKKQESLIMSVLTSNPTAYDGTALFSTSRTYGDNTINNTTTSALSTTTFSAARIAMMSYKDHNDEPLAVMPNVLVVGPKLEKTAYDIVRNYFLTDGATSSVAVENFYRTLGVQIIVSPYLVGSYDDYWFLADTTDLIKGVLLQIREVPSPILSNAQEVARSKTIDYMADGRMAAAAGAPHKIYGGLVS